MEFSIPYKNKKKFFDDRKINGQGVLEETLSRILFLVNLKIIKIGPVLSTIPRTPEVSKYKTHYSNLIVHTLNIFSSEAR